MSRLDVTLVIPTYWTWGRTQTDLPIRAVFDHPTPLDGDSTLPRLLESLVGLVHASASGYGACRILVLTAAVHSDLAAHAGACVDSLIAPFREHYPIAQFGSNELALLRDRLPALGFDSALVGLDSYPNIRNCQLLVPAILGTHVVVALDDDEAVAADYLDIAFESLGSSQDGGRVLGVAGFYEDAGGGLFLPEGEETGNLLLDKARLMNRSTRQFLDAPHRLLPSPVAFGGNMIFHCELFAQVGFDPGITRGEDLDYVLNARLAGFTFWLDKTLRITHLPPHYYDTSPYLKMAEDVRRFIYEREKLRLAAERGIRTPPLADLSPYPGRLLADDLAGQARAALEVLATPELVGAYGTPEHIVTNAQARAHRIAPAYFDFAQTWPRLMQAVAEDGFLREQISAHLAYD